jgi:hypothetical protein
MGYWDSSRLLAINNFVNKTASTVGARSYEKTLIV